MSLIGELTSRVSLTPQQSQNAAIIIGEFRSAGLPASLAAGAIANAWHESRLNHLAHNKWGEDSAGLFQLNVRGLGHGMSLEQRLDPIQNTRKVIAEIKRLNLVPLVKQNPSVAFAAQLFAKEIERCAACGYQGGSSELYKRAETANKFFPTYVGYGFAWWWIPAGALAVGGVALGVRYYLRNR